MTMSKVSTIAFLALLSIAHAQFATDLGFLRGGSPAAAEHEGGGASLDQFQCTIKGASSQDQCDAVKAEDGSKCVWCSVSSYGLCVSEDIATEMKQAIPGIECDDEPNTDDDNAPVPDDDKAPAPPAKDDDVAPSDDSVPDDYWNCLEKYGTSETTCTGAGCAWCDNKGGYGICLDEKTAENANNSYWYTCTMPSEEDSSTLFESQSASSSSSLSSMKVSDPMDPSCVAVNIDGDESSCTSTMDADGNPCDWCSFQGYDFCVNVDQAQMVEQYGASCGDRDEDEKQKVAADLSDPSDTSCVVANIDGDESSCTSTMGADGNPCDWCSFQGYDFCVNVDQAQIVEQYGASCGDREETDQEEEQKVAADLSDPSDTSCVVANIDGDESSCTSTMDADGNPCDWCSFQGYDFCVNVDQAQMVEQYGASCGDRDRNDNSISTRIS